MAQYEMSYNFNYNYNIYKIGKSVTMKEEEWNNMR
jgi:hypothetical protein